MKREFLGDRQQESSQGNCEDRGLGIGGYGLELGLGFRVSIGLWDFCFSAWLWLLYTTFMGFRLGSLINEGYLGIVG